MDLSNEELWRLLQWFHAVQDLNPKYLEPADTELAKRIEEAFGQQG